MALLKKRIVDTCPDCGADVDEYTVQAYPLKKRWKCPRCSFLYVEVEKIEKRPLKLPKEELDRRKELAKPKPKVKPETVELKP